MKRVSGYKNYSGLMRGGVALLVGGVALFALPRTGMAQVSELSTLPAASSSAFLLPLPSDVLTPNKHTNTPYWKIALRLGVNRSNYTNDRYLDNTLLDVGSNISGETDVYSAAGGFGYTLGAEVEYPLNAGLSLLFGADYNKVHFSHSGPVTEPCVDASGMPGTGKSLHQFSASIDYAKASVAGKFRFTSLYILAGLNASYPISSTLTRVRTLEGSNCFYPESGGKQTLNESSEIPDMSSLHYALRLGVGYNYQLTERIQFSPELDLDFGMNRINKSPMSDLGVYSLLAVFRYELR